MEEEPSRFVQCRLASFEHFIEHPSGQQETCRTMSPEPVCWCGYYLIEWHRPSPRPRSWTVTREAR